MLNKKEIQNIHKLCDSIKDSDTKYRFNFGKDGNGYYIDIDILNKDGNYQQYLYDEISQEDFEKLKSKYNQFGQNYSMSLPNYKSKDSIKDRIAGPADIEIIAKQKIEKNGNKYYIRGFGESYNTYEDAKRQILKELKSGEIIYYIRDSKVKDKFEIKPGAIFKSRKTFSKELSNRPDAYYIKIMKIDGDNITVTIYRNKGNGLNAVKNETMNRKRLMNLLNGGYGQVNSFYDSLKTFRVNNKIVKAKDEFDAIRKYKKDAEGVRELQLRNLEIDKKVLKSYDDKLSQCLANKNLKEAKKIADEKIRMLRRYKQQLEDLYKKLPNNISDIDNIINNFDNFRKSHNI